MKIRINHFVIVIIILAMQGHFIIGVAQVTTWQGPPDFSSTRFYQVKVNGVEVPVYDTPIASYCIFDFNGEAQVDIESMFDVRWAEVRPLRCGIKPVYKDNHSFSVVLKEAENISIELNGRIRQQPLFLFSARPENNYPDTSRDNVIWFKAGKLYENMKLELQDNQMVYIEGGAVVQGYIFAEGKKNISISGKGILDGSFNGNTKGNDNRFLSFSDCENIRISDIVLHNGTTWQISLFNCSDVQIKNVRIVSESGGDDGIDVFRCRNVVVDGVFAHTKDDCIAIKSGGEYSSNIATDSILVKNCVFWNSIWGNAVEVGFELYSRDVMNIRFQNIDIIHVEDGAALSIHNAGQSHVHNVVFENIRIEDARQKLIDVAIFFSRWGPDGIHDEAFLKNNYMHGAWDGVQYVPAGKEEYHRQFRGKISDILFKDIQVIGGGLPFSVFYGYDDKHNISKVTIDNLTYLGKKLTNEDDAKIRKTNTADLVIR